MFEESKQVNVDGKSRTEVREETGTTLEGTLWALRQARSLDFILNTKRILL